MSARTFALGLAYGLVTGMFIRTLLDAGEQAARNAPPKTKRRVGGRS